MCTIRGFQLPVALASTSLGEFLGNQFWFHLAFFFEVVDVRETWVQIEFPSKGIRC